MEGGGQREGGDWDGETGRGGRAGKDREWGGGNGERETERGAMGRGRCTLPRQWSLITISQDNHSFHPMFPTDHCRVVSIFRRKVRWRSEHVYTRITDTCRLT